MTIQFVNLVVFFIPIISQNSFRRHAVVMEVGFNYKCYGLKLLYRYLNVSVLGSYSILIISTLRVK